jgi:hypothetical protein
MEHSNLPRGVDIVNDSADIGEFYQPHESYWESYRPRSEHLSSRISDDEVPSPPPPISNSTRFKSNNPFRSLVQDGPEGDTHNGEPPCALSCPVCGHFPAKTQRQDALTSMASPHHVLYPVTTLYGPGGPYVVQATAEHPDAPYTGFGLPTYPTYVPQIAPSFQHALHTGWGVPHMTPSLPHVLYFPSRSLAAGHHLR